MIDVPTDPRPADTEPDALVRLRAVLGELPRRVIACSGGIDSLVLATVAHRAGPDATVVAHTVTPAVPADGTARVVASAQREGWDLELVRSNEFDDEAYLANPVDRCFHCKSHLYTAIDELVAGLDMGVGVTILSGANADDLGEFRPGLVAADQHGVRHPYVEAGLGKADIRAIARHLGLADAELAASPCLASRLYTGTRVTVERLQAVAAGEAVVRELTGVEVVRCRIRGDEVRIEVPASDAAKITDDVVDAVARAMRAVEPTLGAVTVDDRPYRPGRSFVPA